MITIQGLNLQDSKLVEKLAKTMAILKGFKARKGAFDSDDSMFLTAVGASVEMRMTLETKREAMFAKTEGWGDGEIQGYDEVIIGGGPHAATWANVRAAQGNPRPLVVTNKLGGEAFSQTINPWFDLNSRNRPGEGGLSSEQAALNYIPGAPIQGENLNLNEFQTNSDLGYVVRSSLMRNADLRKGFVTKVDFSNNAGRRFRVAMEDGEVYADRVIDARGLGDPRIPASTGRQFGMGFGERVWSFNDFAQRFEDSFPFRDLERVAVIGGGDGGKVVVEALLGIGPSQHLSVPMLDWVEQIDWYDVALPDDCIEWRQAQRGRYQRIGSFLQMPENGRQRLRVFNQEASPSAGLGKIYVAGRPYDAAIVVIGYDREEMSGLFDQGDRSYVYAADDSTRLGRRFYSDELYQVGPRAAIPFDAGDNEATRRISNNMVALFRTLPRTVQLAMGLKPIQPDVLPTKPESRRGTRRRPGRGKPLTMSRTGANLYVGDQVGYRVTRSSEIAYTGTIVDLGPDETTYIGVKRDDGITGGGRDGAWLIGKAQGENLEPTMTVMKGIVLGYDTEGEPIRAGDRVRFIDDNDYDGEFVTGTAVDASDEARDGRISSIGVDRDDGQTGGGPGDTWLLTEDEGNTLELI